MYAPDDDYDGLEYWSGPEPAEPEIEGLMDAAGPAAVPAAPMVDTVGDSPISGGSVGDSKTWISDQPATPPIPTIDASNLIGTHLFEYLSGTAGTGKTYQARAYAEAHQKTCVLCATTGIAAINLGGTTINALLGYFNTESLQDVYVSGRLASRLRSLRGAGLRRIILDEVSMMDGKQLTMIVRALEDVNQARSLEDSGEDDQDRDQSAQQEPLGLTLVGDFGQLPPVPDDDPKNPRKKIPSLFAFQSPEWHRFTDHVHKLTEVKRQDEREFIAAIHAVRRGDVIPALAFFKNLLHDQIDHDFQGSTIVAKNDAVDRFNELRMDRLTTTPVQFRKTGWGKERGEWKQIPAVLTVKPGALVMILANFRNEDTGDYEYVNGDLGEFIELSDEGMPLVRLQRTNGVVVVRMVGRDCTIPLEVGRRKEMIAQSLAHLIKDKYEIVGQVFYMPLRVAYATTCHKSQGLSLDHVQIDLRDHFFSQPGMMFVALSRARTAAGLRVVGSPETFAARCTVDARVRPWL